MPQSFDEAFPGGFEECVRTLGQEDSVDDAEALCGWLQENGFEAIQNESPNDVLVDLEVEYVSVVDDPAQDSEWLVAKSAQADPDAFDPTDDPLRGGEFVVDKQSEEPERKVWAAVLIPEEADKQGDLVPRPEIERAAHNYLKHKRKVDEDHDLVDGSGEPIESYVLKQETTFDMPDGSGERTYPAGTWILGVQLTDDAWKRVESGELTGFSIYGGAASLGPDELLTPKQKEVLLNMDDDTAKKAIDPSDLSESVDAFQDATGEDATDATLVEFVNWVEDNPNYGEEEEESEESEESDGMDEDDEQESSKESETAGDGGDSDGDAETEQEEKDMGDDEPADDAEDEQNEKLDELLEKTNDVQESVEETRKSVESVRDRVDDLEQEVFEKEDASEEEETDDLDEETVEEAAEKAVEKALRDAFEVPEDEDGDLSEVVRKGDAFPDPDHEQNDDDGITLDYSGVVGEEV